jgi:hypothetical protein
VRRTDKRQTTKKDAPPGSTLERSTLQKSQSKIMENKGGFGIVRSEMTEEEVVIKKIVLRNLRKRKKKNSKATLESGSNLSRHLILKKLQRKILN